MFFDKEAKHDLTILLNCARKYSKYTLTVSPNVTHIHFLKCSMQKHNFTLRLDVHFSPYILQAAIFRYIQLKHHYENIQFQRGKHHFSLDGGPNWREQHAFTNLPCLMQV